MRVDIAVDELRRTGFSVDRKVDRHGKARLQVEGPEGATPPREAIEAIKNDAQGAMSYVRGIEEREALNLDFANLFDPRNRRRRAAGERGILRRILGE